MTGINAAGTKILSCSGFELYGILINKNHEIFIKTLTQKDESLISYTGYYL